MESELAMLRSMAYHYASRMSMGREDCEDCASDFVVHLMKVYQRGDFLNRPYQDRLRFFRRCAINFAIQWKRTSSRHKKHEVCWTTLYPNENATNPTSPLSIDNVESHIYRSLFWEVIFTELNGYPSHLRNRFVSHFIRGTTYLELSNRAGCSVHSVEQSVFRMKKRIVVRLAKRGWNFQALTQLLQNSIL